MASVTDTKLRTVNRIFNNSLVQTSPLLQGSKDQFRC